MKCTKGLKPLLVVAGPTATGKSELAVELAKHYNGTLINADSMQVYRDIRILTSRPRESEEAKVPHRLYGFLSAQEGCSAGLWQNLAKQEVKLIWGQGRLPILVGGTGLYIKALLEGISDIPNINPVAREKVRTIYNQFGVEKLFERLEKVDPETTSRLSKNDKQRLIRAYEVYLGTGKSLSEWHRSKPRIPAIKADIQCIILDPPRDKLYEACNLRFDSMLRRGALEEVRALMELHLDSTKPIMKALGVKELVAYLQGKITYEEALDDAKRATRNYAKRQVTWFSNQFGKSERISQQYSERLLGKIFPIIRF